MNLLFRSPIKVFGVKLKDKKKIMQSQSGGAFAAIAEHFINMGAIVYGCSLDENLVAVYSRITNLDDLNTIKGSKYVQANLGNTLKDVLNDLKIGKLVLFSGTPCYVAACKQFINQTQYQKQLYTVDIICHGVPSPLVYKAYLDELSEKEKCEVRKYIFRDKTGGVETTRGKNSL